MLLTGLVDYHINTRLCGHARGELEDYLDEARAARLLELGFTDHCGAGFGACFGMRVHRGGSLLKEENRGKYKATDVVDSYTYI
jgi:histidinol phosphatase-like PHP family hydrolase